MDTVRGYHDAGIRVAVCPSYMDQNKGIYANRDAFAAGLPEPLRRDFLGRLCDRPYSLSDYFGVIDRLLERLAPQLSAGSAALQLHPNGGQWCSDEALLGIRDYALAHGLRIHMHLLETKYQRRYAQDQWGCSFIRHYQEIGFLGPWVSFAHAVWLSDEDIALIAQSGAMVVNNPSSNLRLRSGTMPLKKLLRGGAVCALGMDGCAYDDDQDYLREMRTAMLNPGETGVNAGISPRDVMKMAVCGGAAVVGEGLAAGVIRSGAPADFVCFDLKKLGEFYMSPEVTPLELLVQRGTKHMIEAAYVGGVQVAGRSEPLKRRREEARARMRAAIEQAEAAHKPTDRSLLQAHIRAFYETWEERE
ncbi:5'-deoxyadenosine deaminase [bioreactor metagenome]|uniref:5'-deoxyadenosine deaminase n=1 Tax=bioreactor metagenome TaxID=1076179 RepID=A0A645AM02_9ZZZZ